MCPAFFPHERADPRVGAAGQRGRERTEGSRADRGCTAGHECPRRSSAHPVQRHGARRAPGRQVDLEDTVDTVEEVDAVDRVLTVQAVDTVDRAEKPDGG